MGQMPRKVYGMPPPPPDRPPRPPPIMMCERRDPIPWPDDLAGKIATVVFWISNLLALRVKTWRATWDWIRPRRKMMEWEWCRCRSCQRFGGLSGVPLPPRPHQIPRVVTNQDRAARLAAGLPVEMIQVRPPAPPAPPKRTNSGGPR